MPGAKRSARSASPLWTPAFVCFFGEKLTTERRKARGVEAHRFPVAMLPAEEAITKRREVILSLALRRHVRRHETELESAALVHLGDFEVEDRKLERVTHDEELRRVDAALGVVFDDAIEKRSIARAPFVVVAVVRRAGAAGGENQVLVTAGARRGFAAVRAGRRPRCLRSSPAHAHRTQSTSRRKQRVAWLATPLFMSTRQMRSALDECGIANDEA